MARQLIRILKNKIKNNKMDKNQFDEKEEIIDDVLDQEPTSGDNEESLELGTTDVEDGLQSQIHELKDKYLRLMAEFENYKKRTMKESLDLRKTAAREAISAILPAVDDFARAKKSSDEGKEVFSEGVSLVYQKLWNALQSQGLTLMETDGEVFDPEMHEAITEIPAPSEEMKGRIIDTIEKGYILKDKIIRFPKVVVGK